MTAFQSMQVKEAQVFLNPVLKLHSPAILPLEPDAENRPSLDAIRFVRFLYVLQPNCSIQMFFLLSCQAEALTVSLFLRLAARKTPRHADRGVLSRPLH